MSCVNGNVGESDTEEVEYPKTLRILQTLNERCTQGG